MPPLVLSQRAFVSTLLLSLSLTISIANAQTTAPGSGPVIGVPGTQPYQVAPIQGGSAPSTTLSPAPASGAAQPTIVPSGAGTSLSPQIGSPAGQPPMQWDAGSDMTGRTVDKTSPEAGPADIEHLEQKPIELFDQAKLQEGEELLNNVLTATIVKVREYPVDLPTVLKLVEAQNLFLEDDRLNSKIKSNQYYRSIAQILPDIQGTYNQSRFQGAIQVFGSQTIQVFQTRIVPQATAKWIINPGGQDVFTALAAKQRARGAKFQLQNTIQDQLTQATNEYYEMLAAGVQVANIKVSIQESQSQVALNDARLKAGVGTKLDLQRAKTQLIERERDLITAENLLSQSQQNLLNRLNLDPDVQLIPPQISAVPRILVPLSVNTQQLVARAMKNNPTLKILDQEVRALGYEGKAVLGGILPTVTLQAYINGTGPEIDKLGLGRFGGIALQSDLLSKLGTAIPLDYRTRRLMVKQELVKRQEQARNVQSDVIKAYLDSRAAAKSIFTTQEELDVAQEAYRLAYGRYKAGVDINVNVLNANTALTLARFAVVRSILDFNEAQVRLLKALGDVSTTNILNGMKADAFTQKQQKTP